MHLDHGTICAMAPPDRTKTKGSLVNKRTILHVVLPEDIVAQIDHLAQANGINRTAIGKIAIARFLKNPSLVIQARTSVTKNVTIHIALPKDLFADVVRLAEANHINRPAIAAIAFAKFLESPNLAQ